MINISVSPDFLKFFYFILYHLFIGQKELNPPMRLKEFYILVFPQSMEHTPILHIMSIDNTSSVCKITAVSIIKKNTAGNIVLSSESMGKIIRIVFALHIELRMNPKIELCKAAY